jgi:hypothetical protein
MEIMRSSGALSMTETLRRGDDGDDAMLPARRKQHQTQSAMLGA